MRIALQGIGVVGGFGCGVDQLARALQRARGKLIVKDEKGDFNPVTHCTASSEPLKQFVRPRQLRRIDHFSRLALLGAFLALEDAEKNGTVPDRQKTGVVLATGYGATRTTFGFLDSVIEDGDALASPTHFANSVHNAAAAHVAMLTGTKGPNLTVSRFDASMGEGLLAACQMLKTKRATTVLLGGVDEYCDVLGYCYERMGCQKRAAALGEGAVFFVLSCKNSLSNQASFPKYGWLTDVTKQPTTQSTGKLNVYTDIYGDMPVAPGLDLAIAALSQNGAANNDFNTQAGLAHSGVVFNQQETKTSSATVLIKDWGHFTISHAKEGT